ncbi:hypothetical protein L207DRAFT_582371 [Hyaloscypha variabilis F]|uniref:Uncharacterized protein n=1 Tax=Hyaloscypha variabilis (strain UAMH 11265 / GT02V1 / F) TaxID=1149755 RepID=A0A2J6RTV4_HYAVF|nr:hypothetical protein L207DRAFT_582371 [Hyaloscypha variabilis F]
MSTRIRFSGQAQEVAAYYPGDIIDGIVYLRGPLQDSNLAVSIKLVGSTHSTIFLGKHSVDHDLVLCEVRQELAHELPPTILTGDSRHCGQICYQVSVKAKRSTFFSKNTQMVGKTLSLAPRRAAYLKHDSTSPDPLNHGAWKPSSITLEMAHDQGEDYARLVPQLQVLRVKHCIEARTYFRVPGSPKDDSFAIKWFLAEDFVNWKDKKLSFRADNLNLSLISGETLNLKQQLRFGVPESEQSSFQSYEISRCYSSKTTVQLAYGGLKRNVVFRNRRLTVCPAK